MAFSVRITWDWFHSRRSHCSAAMTSPTWSDKDGGQQYVRCKVELSEYRYLDKWILRTPQNVYIPFLCHMLLMNIKKDIWKLILVKQEMAISWIFWQFLVLLPSQVFKRYPDQHLSRNENECMMFDTQETTVWSKWGIALDLTGKIRGWGIGYNLGQLDRDNTKKPPQITQKKCSSNNKFQAKWNRHFAKRVLKL